jgi:Transposase DDE domain
MARCKRSSTTSPSQPGGGWSQGQSDRLRHRQPEREELGKRGACIDPKGHDAGRKIREKKRHVVVDTSGLLMHAVVHPADVQDRDGLILVMTTLCRAVLERYFQNAARSFNRRDALAATLDGDRDAADGLLYRRFKVLPAHSNPQR